MSNGKGDRPRIKDFKAYQSNYASIFRSTPHSNPLKSKATARNKPSK